MRKISAKKTVTVLAGTAIAALTLAGCQDPTSLDSMSDELDATATESADQAEDSLQSTLDQADAEEMHASALTRQLERMGVDVPDNPYRGLITAPADLTTAATAWAEGEVANVELYDRLISDTDNELLIRVFENLRRASAESHLPAFELAADNGGTLDPGQMSGMQMMHSDGDRGGQGNGSMHSEGGHQQRHGQHQESTL